MPELPEVETVRAGVARHLPGRRVRAVAFRRADLRWPMPVRAVRALVGSRCRAVTRRAKYLLLDFEAETLLLVHLGMTGRLFVDVVAGPRAKRPPWRKHEHWRLDFGDRVLRFVDARRFGVLDVVPVRERRTHKLLALLGPEPLSARFDAAYLFERTRGRTASVKSFLMDARNVAGVGNIYASEACFRAALRPQRAAGTLTARECAALARAVRSVLRDAIRLGGTSMRDYVGAEEEAGWFALRLSVYDREGEPCKRCGRPVARTVDGARATYFCRACQR
jgi:formamidopyrimidine-DNA glycosylase